MAVANILTTGQLGSSSATLQTGGGFVALHLHNTHSASIAVVITLTRDAGTAVVLYSRTLVAGGSAVINGLPLAGNDVVAGYAGTGSKIDYFIASGSEVAPFSTQTFDANGSLLSGGTALSLTNLAISGALTTQDGVASGTARIVGGLVKAGISTTDVVTAVASNNSFISFATTCVVPANTFKAGTIARIRAMVSVNDASGSDTLTCNLLLGSTSLVASTAVNPGATTDIHILDFELTSREAPGAATALVGSGKWITNTGGTIAHGTGLLATTNFATNGALTIASQAKWSSNTANTSARLESFVVEVVG